MAGITRIRIISDWNDRRTQLEEAHIPQANRVYREMFSSIGCPLEDRDEILEVEKEDVVATYDFREGIDILLKFQDGTPATLQEKILDWWEDTMTFEEEKNSGAPGAYYYCTAQYYSTFYVDGTGGFRSWAVINLAALHIASLQERISWHDRRNNREGRRNPFRYVHFRDLPGDCVVGMHQGRPIDRRQWLALKRAQNDRDMR